MGCSIAVTLLYILEFCATPSDEQRMLFVYSSLLSVRVSGKSIGTIFKPRNFIRGHVAAERRVRCHMRLLWLTERYEKFSG